MSGLSFIARKIRYRISATAQKNTSKKNGLRNRAISQESIAAF